MKTEQIEGPKNESLHSKLMALAMAIVSVGRTLLLIVGHILSIKWTVPVIPSVAVSMVAGVILADQVFGGGSLVPMIINRIGG